MFKLLKKGDYFYLVDGLIFIFRVYYFLLLLICKSDGMLVGVVSGFCNMFYKLLQDVNGENVFSYLVVIFDYLGKMF